MRCFRSPPWLLNTRSPFAEACRCIICYLTGTRPFHFLLLTRPSRFQCGFVFLRMQRIPLPGPRNKCLSDCDCSPLNIFMQPDPCDRMLTLQSHTKRWSTACDWQQRARTRDTLWDHCDGGCMHFLYYCFINAVGFFKYKIQTFQVFQEAVFKQINLKTALYKPLS